MKQLRMGWGEEGKMYKKSRGETGPTREAREKVKRAPFRFDGRGLGLWDSGVPSSGGSGLALRVD